MNKNQLISRRTTNRRIKQRFDDYKNELKSTLKDIDHICITADIWSAKRRSFFGVTAHWIDIDTLERKSASLACRRFKGVHNFENIANFLQEINYEFDIPVNKVINIIHKLFVLYSYS